MTSATTSNDRQLFVGTVLNLLGLALPLALAAYAVPLILSRLGTERFGALTLVWAVAGYFSFLDFGLSRALTKRVAEARDPAEAGAAVKAGLLLLLGLGVLAMVLILAIYGAAEGSGHLASNGEYARSAFYLAVGMPFLLVGLGLRGVLEGLQRFAAPNCARLVVGVATFGSPILLLQHFGSLDSLVAALTVARVLTLLIQAAACRRELGWALIAPRLRGEVGALMRFSGWMTVSNLVSPLMAFMDRFIVGASAFAASLAFYTTPFEMVSRVLVIPGAIMTTLFPRMVSAGVGGELSAERIMLRGMRVTLIVVTPVVLALQLFARDILDAWLGGEFATRSTLPMQLIAWGVLYNSAAQFPFAFLQSAGRPDWIAKLHLTELPAYLALLFVLLARFGIDGVAVAWLVRVAIDMACLAVLSRAAAPRMEASPLLSAYLMICLVGIVGIIASFWLPGMFGRLVLLVIGCAAVPAVESVIASKHGF